MFLRQVEINPNLTYGKKYFEKPEWGVNMIYMKNSTNCTQLDKNYDLKIQSMEKQITKLNSYLFNKENPIVMEKLVVISGTTMNALSGKRLTDQELTAPNIPGYKYIGLLGGWGNGITGLLVQQNGWIFNCRNVKTTFENITLKFLYSKEF